jgi:uncharacterized protein (TIGR00251 family)
MPTCRLTVRVLPRASRNQVVGWREGVLHLRLTAPPVEGAANRACVDLLAEVLGLRRAQVTLVAGERSRDKRLELSGLEEAEARARIDRWTGKDGAAE